MFSKKRKSLGSPTEQSKVSKFFKSSDKQKKVPALKVDDNISKENGADEEKKEKKDQKVVEAAAKASLAFANKLTAFKCSGIPASQSVVPMEVDGSTPVASKPSADDKPSKSAEKPPSKSAEKPPSKSDEKPPSKSAEKPPSKSKKNSQVKSSQNGKESKSLSNGKESNPDELKAPNEGEDVVVDRGIMFADIKTLKKKVTFTPLEQQVIAIKCKHMDVLMFVESGYRYRFFGEDAEVAAKELNITAHLDHNFMTASIPVHRLTVHVSRLVELGFKVGVVTQTETAALKAAGDNKNAPFTRKLSNVYTKATFVDREEGDDTTNINTGRYIISICEVKSGNDQPYIGIYCVNPTSGDITCINFSVDDNILTKIETVFCALKPSEVLLPKQQISKKIDEYIKKHCKREEARIERIQPSQEVFVTEEQIQKRLGSEFKCTAVLQCISIMNTYLKEFNLENLVVSLRNYRPYSLEKNCMNLDGSTIKNLELLENTFDRTTKGSLLWVIDHTQTMFGKRLIKRWLLQPLISVKQINKRLDAVTQLLKHLESTSITEIKKQFTHCLDIEKNLTAIFHRKITPAKFITTLEHLKKLNDLLIKHADELNQHFTSLLLQSIFERVPKILGGDIEEMLAGLNKDAASKGKKQELFVNLDDYPTIKKTGRKISEYEERLDEHKDRDVRKILGGPVDYKSVSGSEYLIEVKNKEISKIPKDWVKVSSTKQVTRFRPPFVEETFKKLCQAREKLKLAGEAAWEMFLNDFTDMYDLCRKAILKFAQLDCLLSLATVSKQPDYCRPVFEKDVDIIEIINGRHPVLAALLQENEQYVGNDVHLSGKMKSMIVSGPNMGGKSSYIRQVAVSCILAQIGSFIPATSARLSAIDGVYTRMGANDDIGKGRSTFMVELEQASMIMQDATNKSLVILDELGRGTSTYDGMAIAFAALKFFIEDTKPFTLFVTHYPMLAEFETTHPNNISNHHMAFMSADQQEDEDEEEECSEKEREVAAVDAIIFLYKLTEGAAKKSYGLNVARLAGLQNKILRRAAYKSSEMEKEVEKRVENVTALKSLFNTSTPLATLKEFIAKS